MAISSNCFETCLKGQSIQRGEKIHQDTDFCHSYLKLESGISETAYQLTMAETSVYKARQVSNHLFCSGNVTSTASKV